MKRMLPVAALAVLLVGFSVARPASADAAGLKVKICHVPPGNPDNAHTINVSVMALPAHLAHGDNLGSCFDPF